MSTGTVNCLGALRQAIGQTPEIQGDVAEKLQRLQRRMAGWLGELEGTWKETIMVYLKVPSQHLTRGNTENHDKLQGRFGEKKPYLLPNWTLKCVMLNEFEQYRYHDVFVHCTPGKAHDRLSRLQTDKINCKAELRTWFLVLFHY